MAGASRANERRGVRVRRGDKHTAIAGLRMIGRQLARPRELVRHACGAGRNGQTRLGAPASIGVRPLELDLTARIIGGEMKGRGIGDGELCATCIASEAGRIDAHIHACHAEHALGRLTGRTRRSRCGG